MESDMLEHGPPPFVGCRIAIRDNKPLLLVFSSRISGARYPEYRLLDTNQCGKYDAPLYAKFGESGRSRNDENFYMTKKPVFMAKTLAAAH
jgi:hypothetical protein